MPSLPGFRQIRIVLNHKWESFSIITHFIATLDSSPHLDSRTTQPHSLLCDTGEGSSSLKIKGSEKKQTQNMPPERLNKFPVCSLHEKNSCQLFSLYRRACVCLGGGSQTALNHFSLQPWRQAFSPFSPLPLCKSPNILFPAASFPTLFDILITRLTILLLRNCHIRNIF